jgi:hypothetical protein
MSKPLWRDSPSWARYLAMDKDGSWFWYANKPTHVGTQWWPVEGDYRPYVTVGDWCDTLEERPVHKSSFDYHAEGIQE